MIIGYYASSVAGAVVLPIGALTRRPCTCEGCTLVYEAFAQWIALELERW